MSPKNDSQFDPIPRQFDRIRNFPRHEMVFWVLIFSCVLWLYIFRPIPKAVYNESLAEVGCYLFVIYLAFRLFHPEEGFTVLFSIFSLLVASYAILLGFSLVSNNAEVVLVYADVFEVLDKGGNPYQGNQIYHRVENGEVVYGDFNYLPLEIIPYYAAYSLTGTWDATVLVLTNLILNLLACCILWNVFSELEWTRKGPLLAIVLLTHVNYTSGLTLIFVSLFLALQKTNEGPEPCLAIAIIMGLGFLTKFFFGIIVIFYGWNLLVAGHFKKLAIEFGLGFSIALVAILPFGLENIISATILFQGELETRDILTSFFPNVLSGLMYVIKIKAIYPVVAFLIFFAFLLVEREPKHSRLFLGAILSMFLLPTPEPQYISCIFVIMLWTKLEEHRHHS